MHKWSNNETHECYKSIINDFDLNKLVQEYLKDSKGSICNLGSKIELLFEHNEKYKNKVCHPLYLIDFYEIAQVLIFNNLLNNCSNPNQ